jgi:hypothetical protein
MERRESHREPSVVRPSADVVNNNIINAPVVAAINGRES